MTCLMGIDLGTSGVRAMLIRTDGTVVASEAERYPVCIPEAGHAEQDPRVWWEKTVSAVGRTLEAAGGAADISALAFSGQMHGLVCLDDRGRPVHNAIIWQDQRSAPEIARLAEDHGTERLLRDVQNPLAPGFLLASLLWLRRHKPDEYRRTTWVMLPKDYLKYRFTGKVLTDYSDAAGSGAFNTVAMGWSWDLLDRLGLDRDMFPPIGPSTELVGHVTPEAARATGLARTTWVVNGGGDQPMQAVGNGVVGEGDVSVNLGTGGQVSAPLTLPRFDPERRTATLAHVLPDRWYVMGATLSAGASLAWLAGNVLDGASPERLAEEARTVPAGSGGLFFLPYLTGERTPHLDPDARGVFFGLTPGHDRRHLARAVMEGVAYALRDCLDPILALGIRPKRLIASGGGASSPVWLDILADVLGYPLHRSLAREQACLGAAMTAGVATGIYGCFEDACASLVRLDPAISTPQAGRAMFHNEGLEFYRDLYQANRELFPRLTPGPSRQA